MRIRRLALLSGAAAAIGGAIWMKKSRSRDNDLEEEALLLDLSTPNGTSPDEIAWEAAESELSL
jgi:hypothetical protein